MFILVSFSFVKLPHLGLTYFPKWGFLFIKIMDNKLDDIEILYFAICNQIGLYNSFLEDNKNNLSKEDIEFSEYIIARSMEIRDNMEKNLKNKFDLDVDKPISRPKWTEESM